MENKALVNQLSLAYSPLCNYDFSILKNEKIVQDIIDKSSLYIIAQRQVIRFDKVVLNEDHLSIYFLISPDSQL